MRLTMNTHDRLVCEECGACPLCFPNHDKMHPGAAVGWATMPLVSVSSEVEALREQLAASRAETKEAVGLLRCDVRPADVARAEFLACAVAAGITYEAEGHAVAPGPVEAVVREINERGTRVLDLSDALDAARSELAEARARVEDLEADRDFIGRTCARLFRALMEYVEFNGTEHDDPDCPEDDTCECPTIAALNGTVAAALRVAERFPDPAPAVESGGKEAT